MYTLLLYVHVLALVYWLGGDLGTFLSSRHVLPANSVLSPVRPPSRS